VAEAIPCHLLDCFIRILDVTLLGGREGGRKGREYELRHFKEGDEVRLQGLAGRKDVRKNGEDLPAPLHILRAKEIRQYGEKEGEKRRGRRRRKKKNTEVLRLPVSCLTTWQ